MPDALTFTDSETEATFSRIVRSKGSAERISTDSETWSKAWRLDLDLIDSIGQPLGIQVALIVGRKCMAILVGLADELNRALQAQPGGIGDGQTQFPSGALRKHGESP